LSGVDWLGKTSVPAIWLAFGACVSNIARGYECISRRLRELKAAGKGADVDVIESVEQAPRALQATAVGRKEKN